MFISAYLTVDLLMKALEVSFSSSSPSDLLRPLVPLGGIERFLNICKRAFDKSQVD